MQLLLLLLLNRQHLNRHLLHLLLLLNRHLLLLKLRLPLLPLLLNKNCFQKKAKPAWFGFFIVFLVIVFSADYLSGFSAATPLFSLSTHRLILLVRDISD